LLLLVSNTGEVAVNIIQASSQFSSRIVVERNLT